MCAAPGIKSLYLQLLHNRALNMYVNDLSHARLLRLRLLFEKFDVPMPTFTNQIGQSLLGKYPNNSLMRSSLTHHVQEKAIS